MIKSACFYMKISSLISAFLFLSGLGMAYLMQIFQITSLTGLIVTYLGIILVSIGIIGIMLTALIISIPRVNRRLDHCQH